MSTTLLSLEHVRVQFGRLMAVDGLSFELGPGHLLGFIGPNGAGKSTTLRAAAGLQAVSTGRIHVLGHDVSKKATEVGRHLGFTPDTPAVYDTLTVTQFLLFIARCYDLDRRVAAERIDHWLNELWLTEKSAAKVSTLSRGMKQRLAVARTLLPDPHVILMDEPAAGLDPAGRVHFRQLLANLRDQGKALIVSSHILADLAEYCTHIGMMGHGRMVQFGTVAEITGTLSHDKSRYRVMLAQRVGDIGTRLEAFPEITPLQVDGDTLTIEAAGNRAAAADLLRKLIAAGLPVAEFRPLTADLEQAYLRTGIRQVD